ncbi:hypothetical protein OG784_31840 [Streptomyces sp. NBC_01617]|uniref:hypothetical protein n=1 Tax=unclassified Streptomyces TaxID=2593676 RepID=UPI003869406E|nr:hypothetical protein OG987_31990 [Streptomyces sp. NBC_01620]WTE63041.1 hypothetical protein OG784_31840 [Streptomyces sp. NBC_01617]
MSALRLGGGEIPVQPAPAAATLFALARQLDQYLGPPAGKQPGLEKAQTEGSPAWAFCALEDR